MRWQWRCQKRKPRPLTCLPKHQPCCQKTHTHTHHHMHSYFTSLTFSEQPTTVYVYGQRQLYPQYLHSASIEHPDVWEEGRWDGLKSVWNKWMNVMFEKQRKLPAYPPTPLPFYVLVKRIHVKLNCLKCYHQPSTIMSIDIDIWSVKKIYDNPYSYSSYCWIVLISSPSIKL